MNERSEDTALTTRQTSQSVSANVNMAITRHHRIRIFIMGQHLQKSFIIFAMLLGAVSSWNMVAARAAAQEDQALAVEPAQTSNWAGVISKAQVTAYGYGSHILTGERLDGTPSGQRPQRFALTSKSINLNRWLGKRVIITGQLVEGYPLEGGPPLIAVSAIEPDQIFSVAPVPIAPDPSALHDLARAEWRLISAQGSAGSVSNRAPLAVLRFSPDGAFFARFCNTLRGTFSVTPDSRIVLSNISRTRRGCRGQLALPENFIADGSYDYDITKGYLTIQNNGGYIMFRRPSTGQENPMAH